MPRNADARKEPSEVTRLWNQKPQLVAPCHRLLQIYTFCVVHARRIIPKVHLSVSLLAQLCTYKPTPFRHRKGYCGKSAVTVQTPHQPSIRGCIRDIPFLLPVIGAYVPDISLFRKSIENICPDSIEFNIRRKLFLCRGIQPVEQVGD